MKQATNKHVKERNRKEWEVYFESAPSILCEIYIGMATRVSRNERERSIRTKLHRFARFTPRSKSRKLFPVCFPWYTSTFELSAFLFFSCFFHILSLTPTSFNFNCSVSLSLRWNKWLYMVFPFFLNFHMLIWHQFLSYFCFFDFFSLESI